MPDKRVRLSLDIREKDKLRLMRLQESHSLPTITTTVIRLIGIGEIISEEGIEIYKKNPDGTKEKVMFIL